MCTYFHTNFTHFLGGKPVCRGATAPILIFHPPPHSARRLRPSAALCCSAELQQLLRHALHSTRSVFFPERKITVTSADPHFITPAIKSMLRRKNRLMRAGRTDEAGALAKRVRAAVTRQNSLLMRDCDIRRNTQETHQVMR